MRTTKDINALAIKVLKNEYNGITHNNWCKKVQKELVDVIIARIKESIEEIIKNYWKVEYILRNHEWIYVYHDIIK